MTRGSTKRKNSNYLKWTIFHHQNPFPFIQVKATDADHQQYAEIRYTFVPDATDGLDYFELDPVTGVILTRRRLDRELRSEYTLLVKATDTIGLLAEQK